MKKWLVMLFVLILPWAAWAGSLHELMGEASKRLQPMHKSTNPALEQKPVSFDPHLELTDFRVDESQGTHYWFVRLANHSESNLNKNALELRAYQVDKQNRQHGAGEPVVPTIGVASGRSIQLQREFVPVENAEKIVFEVFDRDSNQRLTSAMFEVDFRTLKFSTQLNMDLKPVLSGNLQASIHWEDREKLWFVQLHNVGSGTAKFSDYDFDIRPAIRGVQYGTEPFTDVNALYDQELAPQRAFRIYVATPYDSCNEGDMISVKITHLDSGKIVRVAKPIDNGRYRVSKMEFEPRIIADCNTIDIKPVDGDLPGYARDLYMDGYITARNESVDGYSAITGDAQYKRTTTAIPFFHVERGQAPVPDRFRCTKFIQLDVHVNEYMDFCGRAVHLRSGNKVYERDDISNM